MTVSTIPQKKDNEEQSAILFRKFATEATNLTNPDIENVFSWIVRTANHLNGPQPTGDLALFLDMDLAILSRPPADYQQYVEQVRLEYCHISDADWTAGRTKVMQNFSNTKVLYFTEEMRARGDAQARKNLQSELSSLSIRSNL